ncbi:MAG TPA: ABC transporter permease [Bacillota bacterium]|nr:ABC transporter permease [Bacillota bacterium]
MAASSQLQPLTETGWRRGFGNLLRKEMGLWFGTSRWWRQAIVWTLILNGIIATVMLASRSEPTPVDIPPFRTAMEVFFKMAAIFTVIGGALRIQDAIIGERQLGTAAWILSKPVARPAFVLTKFLAHVTGMTVLSILLQCSILALQTYYWSGQWPEPLPYLGAMGLLTLNLAYYQAFCLMLGTFFQGRGAVTGAAMGVLFAGQMVPGVAPWTVKLMPWALGDFAVATTTGTALPDWALFPLLVPAASIGLFLAVAVWRFQQEEM